MAVFWDAAGFWDKLEIRAREKLAVMEFVNATEEDHSIVAAIENECFPPDEATSSETILFRLQNASE